MRIRTGTYHAWVVGLEVSIVSHWFAMHLSDMVMEVTFVGLALDEHIGSY
jgi:hypothetical protein